MASCERGFSKFKLTRIFVINDEWGKNLKQTILPIESDLKMKTTKHHSAYN